MTKLSEAVERVEGFDPSRICATCDSPDNLQKGFGAGGLNDVCLGCFYIWYDGPTESYFDKERRHMMTSGESMRRASLLAKVDGTWPFNGSQLPLPTPEEKARAEGALATEARRAETVEQGSVHEGAGPKDNAQNLSAINTIGKE
jgi:hypothetical protein